MKTTVNNTNFTAADHLKDFATKKAEKLTKYNEAITSTEFFLKVDKPDTANNKHAELKVHIPQHELFAEKHADSFEEAIDLCVEAVKKQLIKHKEKSAK